MEIKLETYEDLESHLLATMDSFTDQMCIANAGITKEWYWNLCMGICIKEKDKQKKISDIIRQNVLKEFPEHYRRDFFIPETDSLKTFEDIFE